MTPPSKKLRALALKFPGTEEGVACEGTTLEKRTLKVRGKAFLFLGAADVMVKLGPSLAEANRLAQGEPDRFKAGRTGWTTVRFGPDHPPPIELLERWIAESYHLFAPKSGTPGSKGQRKKS